MHIFDTFQSWRIVFHERLALDRDMRAARGLRDWLCMLPFGPEWRPLHGLMADSVR
jgi:hypothetical protein